MEVRGAGCILNLAQERISQLSKFGVLIDLLALPTSHRDEVGATQGGSLFLAVIERKGTGKGSSQGKTEKTVKEEREKDTQRQTCGAIASISAT